MNTPNTVNKLLPGRTTEDSKAYLRNYYIQHQDTIKTATKKNGSLRVTCEICGKESRKDHLLRHKKLKHYGVVSSD